MSLKRTATRALRATHLEEMWGNAYVTLTQPAHPDFPLEWTGAPPADGRLTRSVFVASVDALDHLPSLSRVIPDRQERHDV